jgi:hypothetical protein
MQFDLSNGGQNISLAQADHDLARVAVPGNPILSSPLANGAVSPVSWNDAKIGSVETFIEPNTNTVINYTLDGHLFDTGVVGLTIYEVGGNTILSIYGCGQNTGQFLAAINANVGASGTAFAGVANNLEQLINPGGSVTIVHH